MAYMTDVYYNENEFVLNAVKEQVEKQYDIECKTSNGYLFIPETASDKWDEILKLLERRKTEAIEPDVALDIANDESKNIIQISVEAMKLLDSAIHYACETAEFTKGVYETDRYVVVFVEDENGELGDLGDSIEDWEMIHSKLRLINKQGGTDRLSATLGDAQMVFELK